MATPLVRIRTHRSGRNSAVVIPDELLRQFNIEIGSSGCLRCGNRSAKVVFSAASGRTGTEADPGELRLSRALLSWLRIPPGVRLSLKKTDSDTLRLGPVIAVLTTDIGMAPGSPDLGICYSSLIRDVIRASRLSGGLVYAFKAKEFEIGNGYVIGYRLSPGSGEEWKRSKMPLPDVIYNRVPNRTAERQPEVRRLKAYFLKRKETRVFNRSFFDKWDVNRVLERGALAEFVPETKELSGPAVLKRMLRDHSMVYLKPQGGSLGKGVVRIIRAKGADFRVRYRMGDRNGFRKIIGLEAVIELVSRLIGHRRYIVQQGIWLARYRGHPFDFRVHLTRGLDGTWGLAGIGAKVAGEGSVTTHVHSGGFIAEAADVAAEVFGAGADDYLHRVAELAVKLTTDLETGIGAVFGEVGLDVGIDRQGRFWLFEINSKPGRSIFDLPSLKSTSQKNWARLLKYCFHLSGFRMGLKGET